MNYVQDAVRFVVDTLDNADTGDCAGIAGLAAAGGIKRGAIKRDRCPAAHTLGLIDDSCFEFDQVGVVIVETLSCGHWYSSWFSGLGSLKLVQGSRTCKDGNEL